MIRKLVVVMLMTIVLVDVVRAEDVKEVVVKNAKELKSIKSNQIIWQKDGVKMVRIPEKFEVVVPAFEGEMGILKDHISIISFLKPGIIKILSKSGDENYYVEDGIVEFKNNNLSILTSSIFNLTDLDKSKQQDLLKLAEEEASNPEINDQSKYLVDQKIEVLRSLN